MNRIVLAAFASLLLAVASVCVAAGGTSATTAQPAHAIDRSKPSEPSEATVHVQIKVPPPLHNSKRGWTLSIQIGENRHYRLDTMTDTVLDLGGIERGWNTFRFSDVKRVSLDARGRRLMHQEPGRSCTGGFAADGNRELQLVIDEDAHQRLVCALR